jgi:hypothetical protein
MKIEGKKRKSGSAIIIAFLLMAVVSGTAFAIAKLFYLDTSLGGLYENSTVAYYAAESGVEEGLLRYRFDRNAEVAAATNDYVNYNSAIRNNLVTGQVGTKATTFGQIEQVYDLNMYYKTKYYGTAFDSSGILNYTDLDNPDYGKEYTIPRDEAVKIDITDVLGTGTGDLTFFVKLGKAVSPSTDNTAFIEARMSNSSDEYKKALIPNGTRTGVQRDWPFGTYANMSVIPGVERIYQIINLKTAIAGAEFSYKTAGDRVFLYLKPIGYDNIIIGLKPTQTGKTIAISAPYSTIKSTGYYGGVGRTLTAKVDRQSGTVYDIFDFVVYQHE